MALYEVHGQQLDIPDDTPRENVIKALKSANERFGPKKEPTKDVFSKVAPAAPAATPVEPAIQPQQSPVQTAQEPLRVPQPPTPAPAEEKAVALTRKGSERLKKDEGLRLKSYSDTEGVKTVGYGFNMERRDALRLFQEATGMGVDDFRDVFKGKKSLNEADAEALFNLTAEIAEEDARILVGNFDEHPEGVKDAIINLSFNLGRTRLAEFEDFLEALEGKDYETAAEELIDSKWYRQVGKRAKRIVGVFENISTEDVPVLEDEQGNLFNLDGTPFVEDDDA